MRTTARSLEPVARAWRAPPGTLAALVWGGAALVAGIACGSSALAKNCQLHIGQAFRLREIEAADPR